MSLNAVMTAIFFSSSYNSCLLNLMYNANAMFDSTLCLITLDLLPLKTRFGYSNIQSGRTEMVIKHMRAMPMGPPTMQAYINCVRSPFAQ